MTSLIEGARKLVTRGSDLGTRLDALGTASQASRGRLDDDLLDEADALVARATSRLRSASACGRAATGSRR